jgi:hypothetical protein
MITYYRSFSKESKESFLMRFYEGGPVVAYIGAGAYNEEGYSDHALKVEKKSGLILMI